MGSGDALAVPSDFGAGFAVAFAGAFDSDFAGVFAARVGVLVSVFAMALNYFVDAASIVCPHFLHTRVRAPSAEVFDPTRAGFWHAAQYSMTFER